LLSVFELATYKESMTPEQVLPWKGDRDRVANDWPEHHRVIPEQCAEWLELRKKYPEALLCVAGDYNTDMGTGSYYGTRQGKALLR